MSAFDEWWPRTPERFSNAREDIARAAYVAGMEQAAKLADEKRGWEVDRMKEAQRVSGIDSAAFNYSLGVHDASGELAEAIRDEAQSAKGLG